MESVTSPDSIFDFTKLTLLPPIASRGTYFSKLLYNKKPLFIETPKCLTKQGIVKGNKKSYSDLLFTAVDYEFIEWIDKLENALKELIYSNSIASEWFRPPLEKSDIDDTFHPLVKLYKSGKYYMIKCDIKHDYNDLPALKIYNEDEIPVTYQDITPDILITPLLEIRGIKFTNKSFNIEIDAKQMVIYNEDKIFQTCIIRKTNKKTSTTSFEPINTIDDGSYLNPNVISTSHNETELMDLGDDDARDELVELGNHARDEMVNSDNEARDDDGDELEYEKDEEIHEIKETETNYANEEANVSKGENEVDELKEVDIGIEWDNLEESVEITKAEDIYAEAYRVAMVKVDEARTKLDMAMKEAEKIKNTYLL